MNKKDLIILTHLRKNARESLTNLSKKTRIPISTIYERLRQHGGALIQKHTALIDFACLGFNTRANVMFAVAKEDRDAFREYLLRHPRINNLSRINNGYDFSIECIFRHVKEMEEFIENLEGRFNIKEKTTYYIIEDIKRETFLTDPLYIDEIAPFHR
mgnify:FL=1